MLMITSIIQKGKFIMQEKIISIRLNKECMNQIEELKTYYEKIFGKQNTTWIIKQAIFQEWLKNIEIPRHNKTTG